MDNPTDQKPKTGAGSMGSYSTITYIVVALVLIFGALLYFSGNWGTTTPPAPTATQESTTPPAPEATAPAPAPATPPATEAAPETGTAPQPPVAPAQ